LKSGKITILPCHNSKASIIWTLPVLEANRIKQLSDEDYLEALNNVLFEDDEREGTSPLLHGVLEGKFMRLADSFSNASAQQAVKSFGSQLIGLAETIIATSQMTDPPLFPPNIMDVIGPRQSVPLSFQQANSYIAPRIALIGDAAHNNAQAGQSLNLGIFDAKELSTLIFDAIEGGSDIGNSLTLKAYDRSRSVKNVSAMGAADLINSTFHERDGLPRGISEMKQIMRSIGMLGLQNMKPIKAEIAKIAMGLK
jgi:2-polyprenyl-6-methoxyphenol hydroxylase-like FAD-dependent oxidoreductase